MRPHFIVMDEVQHWHEEQVAANRALVTRLFDTTVERRFPRPVPIPEAFRAKPEPPSWVDLDALGAEIARSTDWQRFYLNRWERHETDPVGCRTARTDRGHARHDHDDAGEERPVG